MPWVVTSLCRDKLDTSCVSVCPVDCFYVPKQADGDLPRQLYISPDECIDCGACEPACPWEAIYQDEEVPEVLQDAIALNARVDEEGDAFETAEHEAKPNPSPDDVAANKKAHGLD